VHAAHAPPAHAFPPGQGALAPQGTHAPSAHTRPPAHCAVATHAAHAPSMQTCSAGHFAVSLQDTTPAGQAATSAQGPHTPFTQPWSCAH
jgi:hypothetical protein